MQELVDVVLQDVGISVVVVDGSIDSAGPNTLDPTGVGASLQSAHHVVGERSRVQISGLFFDLALDGGEGRGEVSLLVHRHELPD